MLMNSRELRVNRISASKELSDLILCHELLGRYDVEPIGSFRRIYYTSQVPGSCSLTDDDLRGEFRVACILSR